MRLFMDLIDNLTSTVRFIVAAFALCGFLFGMFMTMSASYIAPKVAEDYTERAAELGERAIAEHRAAERERELAKEGWGYGAASPGTGGEGGIGSDPGGVRSADVDKAGGWGEGAE